MGARSPAWVSPLGDCSLSPLYTNLGSVLNTINEGPITCVSSTDHLLMLYLKGGEWKVEGPRRCMAGGGASTRFCLPSWNGSEEEGELAPCGEASCRT